MLRNAADCMSYVRIGTLHRRRQHHTYATTQVVASGDVRGFVFEAPTPLNDRERPIVELRGAGLELVRVPHHRCHRLLDVVLAGAFVELRKASHAERVAVTKLD